MLADCTSGQLPTIRLANPPTAGKVVVKTAKAKATNYKACLALEVPPMSRSINRRRNFWAMTF